LAGFVFAHALHFLQVAAELGGLHAALDEFRRTAGERAGKTGAVVIPKLLVRYLHLENNQFGYFGSLGLGGYYYLREILLLGGAQFGPFMVLALVAVSPIVFFRANRWLHWPGPESVLPAVVSALLVSLFWWLVMPAHVVGNRHITVRHLFVLYFVLVLIIARSLAFRRAGPAEDGAPGIWPADPTAHSKSQRISREVIAKPLRFCYEHAGQMCFFGFVKPAGMRVTARYNVEIPDSGAEAVCLAQAAGDLGNRARSL
jgi:hypothetical protein